MICILSADFLLPDGSPIYRMPVEVTTNEMSVSAVVTNGSAFFGKKTYYTDKNGHLSFDLIQGFPYSIRIGVRSDQLFSFICPAEDSVNLFDLIFPRVVSVYFEHSTYTVAVNSKVTISVYALFSNEAVELLRSGVKLVSSNPHIATIQGKVARGVSVGTTEISIDSVDESKFSKSLDLFGLPFVHIPFNYSISSPCILTVV